MRFQMGRLISRQSSVPESPVAQAPVPVLSQSSVPRRADGQISQNLALFFDAFLGKIVETIA